MLVFSPTVRNIPGINIDQLEKIEEFLGKCDKFVPKISIENSHKGNIALFITLNIYKLDNLTQSFIQALNEKRVLDAALFARCFLEVISSCNYSLVKLEQDLSDDFQVKPLADFQKSIEHLNNSILSTRDETLLDPEGYDDGEAKDIFIPPESINILTMLQKLHHDPLERNTIESIYMFLSDMCHPNIGMNNIFVTNVPEDAENNSLSIQKNSDIWQIPIFFLKITGVGPDTFMFSYGCKIIQRFEKLINKFSLENIVLKRSV